MRTRSRVRGGLRSLASELWSTLSSHLGLSPYLFGVTCFEYCLINRLLPAQFIVMPGKSSEAQKEARANLQKKITALIGTYELPLPSQYINVDEGHNITTTNKISRELIGDSWMLWFITSELVKLYPNESSELYAVSDISPLLPVFPPHKRTIFLTALTFGML